MNVFSGYISEGWRGFLLSIDPKPEAVWSCSFSGRRIGPLGEPRDRCGKAAGGCLAGTSFQNTIPKAGGTFRRVSTQSRRLSGGNIFSGYISGRWRDFLQRIDQKPKAVWREYFFGVHFQRLERLFGGDQPKVESCLELHFFGLSQQATWGASRLVGKGSRR